MIVRELGKDEARAMQMTVGLTSMHHVEKFIDAFGLTFVKQRIRGQLRWSYLVMG